jgi:hypothetical protein
MQTEGGAAQHVDLAPDPLLAKTTYSQCMHLLRLPETLIYEHHYACNIIRLGSRIY